MINTSLEVIEKEALSLQALGDFAQQDASNMDQNLDDLFD